MRKGVLILHDLKRIFSHLGPFRREFILSILFIIAETGFELVIPLIMADIIDVGVANRNIHYILIKGTQNLPPKPPLALVLLCANRNLPVFRHIPFPIWIILPSPL